MFSTPNRDGYLGASQRCVRFLRFLGFSLGEWSGFQIPPTSSFTFSKSENGRDQDTCFLFFPGLSVNHTRGIGVFCFFSPDFL